MAESREKTINTQVSVSYFPRERQWKPRVLLLSLRLPIFIIVSLLSFYRWLQGKMPTAPCSADSLDEQEPLSPDVPPLPTSMHRHCQLSLSPPPYVRGDSILENAVPDKKERERSDSNTRICCQQLGCMGRCRSPDCSLQTIAVMNFDPWCSLPARNSREKMPDIQKRRGAAKTGASQHSWHGGVCEAPGTCPGPGWWEKPLAPQPAFLLPHGNTVAQ